MTSLAGGLDASGSVLTRFGGESAAAAGVLLAAGSSSRALLLPVGATGENSGGIDFEALRFVGLGFGVDFVLGDRLPCGDEVVWVGVWGFAMGVVAAGGGGGVDTSADSGVGVSLADVADGVAACMMCAFLDTGVIGVDLLAGGGMSWGTGSGTGG